MYSFFSSREKEVVSQRNASRLTRATASAEVSYLAPSCHFCFWSDVLFYVELSISQSQGYACFAASYFQGRGLGLVQGWAKYLVYLVPWPNP